MQTQSWSGWLQRKWEPGSDVGLLSTPMLCCQIRRHVLALFRPFFWPMHEQPVFEPMGFFKGAAHSETFGTVWETARPWSSFRSVYASHPHPPLVSLRSGRSLRHFPPFGHEWNEWWDMRSGVERRREARREGFSLFIWDNVLGFEMFVLT
jgi:hypothetical protein